MIKVKLHAGGLLEKTKSELMRNLLTDEHFNSEFDAEKLLDAYVELTIVSNLPESEHERLLNSIKDKL